MLFQIIKNLTIEQEAELLLRGIKSPLISMWRNGKRRPTYAQAVSLALVTKNDVKDLLLELAAGEAHEKDKEAINSLLRKDDITKYQHKTE